jgi:hypothetical protein
MPYCLCGWNVFFATKFQRKQETQRKKLQMEALPKNKNDWDFLLNRIYLRLVKFYFPETNSLPLSVNIFHG